MVLMPMNNPPVCIVDAFTDRPFTGNPAAVVRLDAPTKTDWMQAVAAEMNLSETAFLTPAADDRFRWGLRWFTPTVEVDLCGHATLAAAHVLWTEDGISPDLPLRFETRSGTLTAHREPCGTIWLDFPALGPEVAEPPSGLLDALGLEASAVRTTARSRFDWLVEVETAADLFRLQPNPTTLAQIETRGVIVTARSSGSEAPEDADFLCRFFAPRAGVPEDPVTGSAHCVLAPFWAERLGKRCLRGYQASRRGGVVQTRLDADRVHIGGRAVTVVRGLLVFA
ncbi:MAG: isomerase [Isosphaeraceae bacterium]|nr:MAG: isomerase [Isosphaeraceae bacterium]